MKTLEEITIENENLKRGNIKVWEQLEESTEILSHHEAYISLLEEENAQLKELLKECVDLMDGTGTIAVHIDVYRQRKKDILNAISQALGEDR